MAVIKLTDLINAKALQEIQDGFIETTQIALMTTDVEGKPITRCGAYTDLSNAIKRANNNESDADEATYKTAVKKATTSGRVYIYTSTYGMTYFVAPILYKGKPAGYFVGGHVVPEKQDADSLNSKAEKIGYDAEQYSEIMSKATVVPKTQFESSANYIFTIGKCICDMAEKSSGTQDGAKASAGTALSMSAQQALRETDNISKKNVRKLQGLAESFERLSEVAEQSMQEVNNTKDTVKVIQDIAMNTRILGFNASIEASRAKESGKGFGVIAQEVRNLAETSKTSADKIDDIMKKIVEYTSEINDQIQETEKLVKECYNDLNDFSETLEKMQDDASIQ